MIPLAARSRDPVPLGNYISKLSRVGVATDWRALDATVDYRAMRACQGSATGHGGLESDSVEYEILSILPPRPFPVYQHTGTVGVFVQ